MMSPSSSFVLVSFFGGHGQLLCGFVSITLGSTLMKPWRITTSHTSGTHSPYPLSGTHEQPWSHCHSRPNADRNRRCRSVLRCLRLPPALTRTLPSELNPSYSIEQWMCQYATLSSRNGQSAGSEYPPPAVLDRAIRASNCCHAHRRVNPPLPRPLSPPMPVPVQHVLAVRSQLGPGSGCRPISIPACRQAFDIHQATSRPGYCCYTAKISCPS